MLPKSFQVSSDVIKSVVTSNISLCVAFKGKCHMSHEFTIINNQDRFVKKTV